MEYRCARCKEETETNIKLKFFANTQRKTDRDPKYSFVVSAYCSKCQQYIKHLPQNEELMTEINDYFEKFKINI